MRRSRFNLGPKPADGPSPSPKKTIPKYKATSPKRVQNTTPINEDPIAKEIERCESDSSSEDQFTDIGSTRGLPRAQLELEYNAVLQEREMLLNQLAKCLENMMKT